MDATLTRGPPLTLQEFCASLSGPEPPSLSPAHQRAQADEGGAGDWVHAYLHRKEGDKGNAAYWYRRARRPFPKTSLDGEWADIAETLLREPA
jgi:hypothetical protein